MRDRIRRRALVLPVGMYKADEGFPPLPMAEADALQLADALTGLGYECQVMANLPSAGLGAKVMEAIEATTSDEVLVIAVQAHGIRSQMDGFYVIGVDGAESPRSDVEDWLRITETTSGGSVLFLLDVCFAGTATRLPWQTDPAGERRAWVLAAGGTDRVAFETTFTNATTQALKRLARGQFEVRADSEYVPISDLARTIRHEMSKATAKGSRYNQEITSSLIHLSDLDTTPPFFLNPSFPNSASRRADPPRMLVEGQKAMAVAFAPPGVLPDEGNLALIGTESGVSIFRADSGAQVGSERSSLPYSIAAAPGVGILVGGRGKRAGFLRIGPGQHTDLAFEHESQINAVAISSDHRHAATVSDDGDVKVWDLERTEPLWRFDHGGYANVVAFTGSGLCVTGDARGVVRGFNQTDGTVVWDARHATGPVHALAVIDHDGRTLIVAGYDSGGIVVAEAGTGLLVERFSADNSPVRGLAVAGTSLVASISGDGTVRLWDLRSTESGPIMTGSDSTVEDGWAIAAAWFDDRLHVLSGHARGALMWTFEDVPAPSARAPFTAIPQYYARILADVAEGEDRLDIRTDVETLCNMILARDVRPPLSVGLFGDWGTGKSFFMNRMRQRIDDLATAAEHARLEGNETGFCSGVCQIEFNAWHYVDTNLWATLASRIFDQLAGGNEVRGVLEDLPSVRALRDTFEERKSQAETRLAELDEQLAKQELIGFRDLSLSAFDGLRDSTAKQTSKQFDALLGTLGVPREKVEKLDLRAMILQLKGTGGRLLFLMRRGRWTVRLILILAATLAAGGPPLLTVLLRGHLSGAAGWLTSTAVCLVTALLLVKPYLKRVEWFVTAAEQVVTMVDQQRHGEALARSQVLRRTVTSTQDEISVLDTRIDTLRDSVSVRAFASKRLAGGDYGKHEGLLSLLRGDLEELSRRLNGSMDLERIVLYIDDLDRCPAERVVEVLQAIHLLLAFPLFVVVVGVDSRWLLKSLQVHYQEELGGDGGDEHWAATPQNYLEKIFQISLCLRPMSQTGYARLVTADLGSLLEDEVEVPAPVAETPSTLPDSLPAETDPVKQPMIVPEPAPVTPSTRLCRYRDRGQILAVGFSALQPVLLSVDASGRVSRRDLRSSHELIVQQHATGLKPTLAQLTADDRAVLIGDEHALIVSSRTGQQIAEINVNGEASSLQISRNGRTAVANWKHQASHTEVPIGARTELDSEHMSDDVLLLIAGSWSVIHNSETTSWTNGSISVPIDADPSCSLATNADESLLTAIDETGRVQLWTITETASPVSLPAALSAGWEAALPGPSGLLAVTAGSEIQVWDHSVGRQTAELTASGIVTAIAFSDHGRRLAVGTTDGYIEVWLIGPEKSTADLSLEALRITRAEADAIVAMEPLINTPRSARRLINIYRLLRAGQSPEELERLQTKDHGAVLLLLAMLMSFPQESADLLERLVLDQDPLPEKLTELIDTSPRLTKAVDRVVAAADLSLDSDTYRHWAPHVTRFSFRTSHLV